MSAGADPLAGIGAAVGAPPASSNTDPLAGLGAPVGGGTIPTPASANPTPAPQPTSIFGRFKNYLETARAQNEAEFDAHPILKAIRNVVNTPMDMNKGALRGAALTASGLAHIARQATGTTGSTTDAEKDLQEFGEGGDTGAEEAGKFIESAGEFMLGDEALKGLSYVDRLKKVLPALKVLEKSPILARAVDAAMQQGTIGGVQGFAKSGGDVDTAAESAAGAGVTGGLTEGAAGGIRNFVNRTRPAVEDIAGEQVPTLASQRPGTGPRSDVKINETPKIAVQQANAAPRVFRNIAQRATHTALEEANQGRAVAGQITDPARMLPAPEEAQPYTFTIPGTDVAQGTEGEIAQPAAKRPQAAFKQPSFVTSSAPETTAQAGDFSNIETRKPYTSEGTTGSDVATSSPREPARDVAAGGGTLTTASPEMAQAHLSRLNELLDHPPSDATSAQKDAIEEARDSLQEQMDLYHSYQRTLPNFAPLDAGRAAQGVMHFGDAADQLQNAAKPIYQKLDEATGGEFNRLNRARTAAAKRGDFTAKYDYEDQLDQLIENAPGVTQAERQQANTLWSKSKVLDGIHDAINHAANVDEKYASQVAGGRVLSGTRLQNGLQGLIRRYGQDRLEGVVGADGMQNLTRMADLLKVPDKKGALQTMGLSVLHNVLHGKLGGGAGAVIGYHLGGYEGSLAGAYAGAKAERWMLQAAATNPRVGQLLDYAVRNNVTPKLASSLIANAIIQANQPEKRTDAPNPPDGSPQRNYQTNVVPQEPSAPTTSTPDNSSLPVQALRAVQTLPEPLQRVAERINPTFVNGPERIGNQGRRAVASVTQGTSNPDTIEIDDPASFRAMAPQTVGHELTHTWQNNLPPSIQAKIPADPQDSSAFDISDVDKLRKEGATLATIPREKAATIVQTYIAQPSQRARLQPWIDDMGKTPLSSTMPTTDKDKGLNMTPRPPGLPGPEVAGMSEPTHRRKGRR